MNKYLKRLKQKLLFAIIFVFLVNQVLAQDGEQLFQQCKACHTIGQGKLLGPDLLDISKDKTRHG